MDDSIQYMRLDLVKRGQVFISHATYEDYKLVRAHGDCRRPATVLIETIPVVVVSVKEVGKVLWLPSKGEVAIIGDYD